jgi:hypothetical protein
MEVLMRTAVFALLLLSAGCPRRCSDGDPPAAAREVANLSGPRFGITSLSDGVIAKLQERDIEVRPMITQFGWQFEKEFYSKDSGVAAINEWVALVGGLDQGVVLPASAGWSAADEGRHGVRHTVRTSRLPASRSRSPRV